MIPRSAIAPSDRGSAAGPARRATLCTLAAAVCALAVFALGIAKGARIAGGSDSSGYLSEAVMFAEGRLSLSRPIARTVPWPFADRTFAPLGWNPGPHQGELVPVYAPGYPLTMAAVARVAGRGAMFLVIPALAALAVWATFLLGRRIDGPITGTLAAILLASSPPFLYQLLQPMSDVATTGWWAASVALAAAATPSATLAAGLVAGLAVLTRPNLAPVGAAIGLYLVARDWLAPAARRRLAPPLAFAIPFAAAGAAIAWIQHDWYGSPFTSGYGPPEVLYSASNSTTNLHRYTRWLFATETRLVLAGLVAPIVMLRRSRSRAIDPERMRLVLLSLATIAIVFASYLFYTPFDNWSYLRFLLPAYPMLFVLAMTSLSRAATSLGQRGAAVFLFAAWAVVIGVHVTFIRDNHLLDVAITERRYKVIAEYVARRVPPRVILITVQNSGSLHFYAGRVSLRWDWLEPRWLDEAVTLLRQRGYQPMLLLEDWEVTAIRERFSTSPISRLDWTPRAEWSGHGHTALYDPADRERYLAGERWAAEDIR
jgi:oligosaccharyl transferase STT3 subunit